MVDSPRSVYLRTLGCPKNQVDSELMGGGFGAGGFAPTADPTDADVLVVNTCGFIGPAREASVEAILELAAIRRERPASRLVVTGCLSQIHADELAAEIPEVDLFVGSGGAGAVVDQVRPMLDEAPTTAPRVQVGRAGTLYDPDAPRRPSGPPWSAYVKIAEGCSQQCSFCIIPRLRGKARSRSMDAVETEVRMLVEAGAREINLIAQDLTHYGEDLKDGGHTGLPPLLRRLRSIGGLRWLRLMYCYPDGFGDDLLTELALGAPLVPYLDMPLQHIDDDVLRGMRRRFSEHGTRRLLAAIRARVPDIFLRTTFIAGFPGETIRQANKLRRFASTFRFDHAGAFAYSTEVRTPSGRRPDQVGIRTRARRADRLGEVLREASIARLEDRVGQVVEAVVEAPCPDAGLYTGRHWGQAPEIDGTTWLAWEGEALAPGTFVRAAITHAVELDAAARVLEVVERPTAA